MNLAVCTHLDEVVRKRATSQNSILSFAHPGGSYQPHGLRDFLRLLGGVHAILHLFFSVRLREN